MKKNNYKKIFLCAGLFFLFSYFAFSNYASAATAVTQNGITWTFDGDYEIGQFINGDYYVITNGDNDVDIISISPGHVVVDDLDKNGSMINPIPGYNQGYIEGNYYVEEQNAGKDLPLALAPGSSLISTVSVTETGYQTSIKSAAVLTVVSEAPPAGSFRPGYAGTNKVFYNESNLNYGLLAKLPLVTNAPATPSEIEDEFKRVWVDNLAGWVGNWMHPADNMPAYGDNMAQAVGRAACALHLNYTDEQKRNLLIYFVQIGIDFYSIYETGVANDVRNIWHNDGGVAHGRKTPILFAGLMLNDAGMKAIGEKSGDYILNGTRNTPPADYFHFGEDDQTFYVTQDTINYGQNYTSAMIGMPEWGIRAASDDTQNNASWLANYRAPINSKSYMGLLLPMYIMGAKELWNHDALFDYTDRARAIAKGLPDPFGYTVPNEAWEGNEVPVRFVTAMWDAYRADYDTDDTPPSAPSNLSVL